jgi:small neutral amino acid transporter SnatA (MarC family)
MLINVLVMLVARQAYRILGEATLRILGAVFSILQLSLGIEMIYWSVKVKLLQ